MRCRHFITSQKYILEAVFRVRKWSRSNDPAFRAKNFLFSNTNCGLRVPTIRNTILVSTVVKGAGCGGSCSSSRIFTTIYDDKSCFLCIKLLFTHHVTNSIIKNYCWLQDLIYSLNLTYWVLPSINKKWWWGLGHSNNVFIFLKTSFSN